MNASMYDATQGDNSGAHISVTTKSGTNQMHGVSLGAMAEQRHERGAVFLQRVAGDHRLRFHS